MFPITSHLNRCSSCPLKPEHNMFRHNCTFCHHPGPDPPQPWITPNPWPGDPWNRRHEPRLPGDLIRPGLIDPRPTYTDLPMRFPHPAFPSTHLPGVVSLI